MAAYHLYYLRNAVIVDSDDIEAETVDAAVNFARQRGVGQMVEVWSPSQRLRIVPLARAEALADSS